MARKAVAKNVNLDRKKWFNMFTFASDMVQNLFSRDRPTRRMTFFFFACMIGATYAVLAGYARHREIRKYLFKDVVAVEETGANLGHFIQRQGDIAKQRVATITLGKFTVSLKALEGVKASTGVLNLATVEIVLECDQRNTRYIIEDNLPKVRDQVAGLLNNLERDELFTKEGKRRLKKKLMDRLNIWLPTGKIEGLFFSEIIIS